MVEKLAVNVWESTYLHHISDQWFTLSCSRRVDEPSGRKVPSRFCSRPHVLIELLAFCFRNVLGYFVVLAIKKNTISHQTKSFESYHCNATTNSIPFWLSPFYFIKQPVAKYWKFATGRFYFSVVLCSCNKVTDIQWPPYAYLENFEQLNLCIAYLQLWVLI